MTMTTTTTKRITYKVFFFFQHDLTKGHTLFISTTLLLLDRLHLLMDTYLKRKSLPHVHAHVKSTVSQDTDCAAFLTMCVVNVFQDIGRMSQTFLVNK